MDPSGPPQPTHEQAYTTPGNPVSENPAEQAASYNNAHTNTAKTGTRRAGDVSSDPTPSALGAGTSGRDRTDAEAGRPADEQDGEQMATFDEGKIMQAQLNKGKTGGQGEEESFTSDLDRKKKEQQGMRENIQQARQSGRDVDGNMGGPATVEGGTY